MYTQTETGLTPNKLQLFIAGLTGLNQEEVKKAKVLFLRNELSQLKAMQKQIAGFGVAQGCFAIIPFFWPILWAQRNSINASLTLQKDRIRNALTVWRDDLGSDFQQLEAELESLS